MKESPQRSSYHLTEGNIWLSIWKMSWPMTLIMFCQFIMGIVDIYAAGLLGPSVQASVGFCMQILFVLSVFANAMGVGSLSLISRASGAGNIQRVVEIAKQSMLCAVVFSLIISVFLMLFAEDLVNKARLPAQIYGLSTEMLNYFSIALANNYLIIMANAIFRARGEAKLSLFVMVSMNLINILLIFPLVFGLGSLKGLGAIGLPISMVIATFWGVGLSLYLFTKKQWSGFYSQRITLIKEDIISILSIGLPNAVTQIAWHVGSIVLMSILGTLGEYGITAIAAMTNGLRIEAVIYLPAFALNMAASVLVGHNIGADNKERAIKTGWYIALVGVIIVSVLAFVIFFFSPYIASFVSSNDDVQKEIVNYLRINMPIEPIMALGVILAGAMQGAGDTKGVMKIIVLSMWFVRIPLAWSLAVGLQMGATGVWIAMITSMACQGILLTLRFKKAKWALQQSN